MLINCNAKINIGLEILNKRDDGFHNINTIFCKIPFFDDLIIEKSPKFEFNFNSDLKITDEENLAFKAAMEIKRIGNFSELPVSITINKHIPAGAGLAGGSSNAGCILKSLVEFLDLDISISALMSTAAQLGSDVPFFLSDSRSVIAKGKGELLEEINFPLPFYILLVMPDFHISTQSAYKLMNRSQDAIQGSDYRKSIELAVDNPKLMKKYFKNDFELPLFNLHPKMSEIKENLYNSGAVFASMTGSGSTLYGLFETKSQAKTASTEFKQYKTHISNLNDC